MRLNLTSSRRRMIVAGLAALAGVGLTLCFLRPIAQVTALIAGAALIVFITLPLARQYERRFSRSMAALLALLSEGLALLLAVWLLLPSILREFADLARTLPDMLRQLTAFMDAASAWISRRLPGVTLPRLAAEAGDGLLSRIASGSFTVAVGFADGIGTFSLQLMLAYFFLCDRDRLLLRLELLLPQKHRGIAAHMGSDVLRELRLYVGGQLIIVLAVSALATIGLALAGVRSPLALGAVIGVMNIIPYFGPYIGGVPAVLIALGDGPGKAALTVAVLLAVQQLDGSVISPGVMGSVTGFSPALVLVGIFAGARLAGIPGMLFALPAMLVIRTLYRVLVQRYENI